MPMTQHSSSWGKSSKWYGKIVGDEGHYYHQHTVIPSVLRLLDLKNDSRLLDVGCGQGVLSRSIPRVVEYCGLDIADPLIAQAQQLKMNAQHRFLVTDATKPFPVKVSYFTHAAVILALQNMQDSRSVIRSCASALQQNGVFVTVLNHPCFRIPRQSGWEIDPGSKQQRRWINRYLSPMEIPILMHPGQEQSESTISFHKPISSYVEELVQAGFAVVGMEELVSDKESVGKAAKMENRSRSEIPLFLSIKAVKVL